MLKTILQQLPKEYKIKGKIFTSAKVVKIDMDETHKIGRIKVQIDELFKGIATDDLPWIMMRVKSKSGFSFIVPRIDDIVAVEFMDDNVYTGFYTCRIYNEDSKSDVADEDYPDTYVLWADYKENLIKFNTKTDEFTFEHSSKTKVFIDKDGNVTIDIPKKLNINTGDDTTIDITGNLVATISKDTTITTQGDTSIITEGSIDLTTTGDTVIDTTGELSITTQGETAIQSSGEISIDATADISIDSSSKVNVTAPQINLN